MMKDQFDISKTQQQKRGVHDDVEHHKHHQLHQQSKEQHEKQGHHQEEEKHQQQQQKKNDNVESEEDYEDEEDSDDDKEYNVYCDDRDLSPEKDQETLITICQEYAPNHHREQHQSNPKVSNAQNDIPTSKSAFTPSVVPQSFETDPILTPYYQSTSTSAFADPSQPTAPIKAPRKAVDQMPKGSGSRSSKTMVTDMKPEEQCLTNDNDTTSTTGAKRTSRFMLVDRIKNNRRIHMLRNRNNPNPKRRLLEDHYNCVIETPVTVALGTSTNTTSTMKVMTAEHPVKIVGMEVVEASLSVDEDLGMANGDNPFSSIRATCAGLLSSFNNGKDQFTRPDTISSGSVSSNNINSKSHRYTTTRRGGVNYINKNNNNNKGTHSNTRRQRPSVVVLPGLPRYEEDWARDSHDFFNLVVLVPLVALNVLNWNWDIILHGTYRIFSFQCLSCYRNIRNILVTIIALIMGVNRLIFESFSTTTDTVQTPSAITGTSTGTQTTSIHGRSTYFSLPFVISSNFNSNSQTNYSSNTNYHESAIHQNYTPFIKMLQSSWTGDWFDAFFIVTVSYFVIDLVWILLVPQSVRSPSTIVQHHIATLLYILIPYHHSDCRWCMGACMIVEVNTWFLIARRVFNKQGFPPWTIVDYSFLSIRIKVISILFYTTWIAIRVLLYPMLIMPFYETWISHSKNVGTHWNLVLLCIPLHAIFCLLNLKWTYELLMSKIRYWKRLYSLSKNTSANGANIIGTGGMMMKNGTQKIDLYSDYNNQNESKGL